MPRLLDRAPAANGRREHKKQLTRRELLVAGRHLFATKGLYDSRIEDLTREAGIAKGTLYGYFANREELIEAVVRNGFDELLGFVHRSAGSAATRGAVLTSVVQAHLEFFDRNPDLVRIFHQVRGLLKFNGPESRGLRAVLEAYLEALAGLLQPADPSRGRTRPARDLAMVVFGAVSGIVSVHASAGRPGDTPPRSPRTVRALVALATEFGRTGSGGKRPAGPPGPRPRAARPGGRAARRAHRA